MLTTRLPSHCVRNYSVYTDPVVYSARFKRPSYNYWQLLHVLSGTVNGGDL